MATSFVKANPTQTRRALKIRSLRHAIVQNIAASGPAD
jgi:hypothetical protein